jgi:hypothetical protein
MAAQLLHGLGVSFYELPLRLVKSLDEFVHIIYRGHLEITSIVALSLGTPQESYAIHHSAWKGNSPKFGHKRAGASFGGVPACVFGFRAAGLHIRGAT